MTTWTAEAALQGDVALIVDDVPDNLALLSDALSEAGYTVLVATDGQSAIESLQRVVPDIILLDAVMPGIDGFETCRRIKQMASTQHVPVIFMTGLSETAHVVEGFDAGGVDYVVKPLRAQEVQARLATHVRNARAVRLARDAVDVGGHGVLVVDARGRIAWQSPQAQRWLSDSFAEAGAGAPQAAAVDDAAAPEAIVVTGSRIIRDGSQAPTPVTAVTAESLTQSAPSNIPDALNKLPQFTGSTSQSAGGTFNAGSAPLGNYLNLRGLGTARNLILLDGQRVVERGVVLEVAHQRDELGVRTGGGASGRQRSKTQDRKSVV
mgnify:CR=1 FL=1